MEMVICMLVVHISYAFMATISILPIQTVKEKKARRTKVVSNIRTHSFSSHISPFKIWHYCTTVIFPKHIGKYCIFTIVAHFCFPFRHRLETKIFSLSCTTHTLRLYRSLYSTIIVICKTRCVVEDLKMTLKRIFSISS